MVGQAGRQVLLKRQCTLAKQLVQLVALREQVAHALAQTSRSQVSKQYMSRSSILAHEFADEPYVLFGQVAKQLLL